MFVFVLLCIALCPFYFCNHLEEEEKAGCNHLEEEEKAGCLLLLSYRCLLNVNVLWLFLTEPWVGLQCSIVVVPKHTHLLLDPRFQLTFLIHRKQVMTTTT